MKDEYKIKRAAFEKRNPIEDDDLRSKKDDLAMAVNDCLQSG